MRKDHNDAVILMQTDGIVYIERLDAIIVM